MLPPRSFRSGLLPSVVFVTLCCLASPSSKAARKNQHPQLKGDAGVSITDFGAVGDGTTLNTKSIQAAIDHTAAQGGGTVVIPAGLFVSGAIFLKPKVNLSLEKGGVLRCSTDMKNFPQQRIRIEGHFEEKFTPALINANGCNGLQITGEGTLDGAGRPLWDQFWKLRHASADGRNFNNLSIPRAQLCIINNSKNVLIDGIIFKDSQFWNLHPYHCRHVTVQNARFQVPDDYKQAPSTDGIDVDSCQDVAIKGCYFSVTDDCIALKGSKGPDALDDKNSPPVEHVRISDCTFRRGDAAVTCGSEATIVRDLVVENCRITGAMNVLRLKLRSDTPQRYEDLHLSGLTLDNAGGTLVNIAPWTQYTDLKGEGVPPPKSTVRTITISNVKGRYGKFGTLKGIQGHTKISDITLENIDVQLKEGKFKSSGVTGLAMKNVSVNGVPGTAN
jgi:polygalacturonase